MPTIDPAMAQMIADLLVLGDPPLETLTPVAARALAERQERPRATPTPMAAVEERELGGVRVRLYTPGDLLRPAPCIAFIHGGGWVICSLDTHDEVCRRLAAGAAAVVASIDYRLAPEHPFPAGLDDCLAALAALRARGDELGIDAGRLVLAGDSAGANLALACCLAARDRGLEPAKGAALIYGAYSDDHDSPSHTAFGGGDYLLTTAAMRWFWDHYVPDARRRHDPLATPLHADLRGLPPLFVTAAELDPLRDDSERLARRLIEAGADLDYRLWRGLAHGVVNYAAFVPAGDAALREVAGFLARRLAA